MHGKTLLILLVLLATAERVAMVKQKCGYSGNTNGEWGPCEEDNGLDGQTFSEEPRCYQIKHVWSPPGAAWKCGFHYSLLYRQCNCSQSQPRSLFPPAYVDSLYHYNYWLRRGLYPPEDCECKSVKPEGRLYEAESQCGERDSDASVSFRVLGGQTVRPLSWKWVASLVSDRQRHVVCCGATLIAPQWALTAAHCLHDGTGRPRFLKLVISDHNRVVNESTEQIRNIDAVYMPPGYELFSTHRDIALLKLDQPVERSPLVNYACLPSLAAALPPGSKCFITGWGKTEMRGSNSPEELQEAEVPLVNWQSCKEVPSYSFITKRQLCAGVRGERPRDACAGDSGGGLFCRIPSELRKAANQSVEPAANFANDRILRQRKRTVLFRSADRSSSSKRASAKASVATSRFNGSRLTTLGKVLSRQHSTSRTSSPRATTKTRSSSASTPHWLSGGVRRDASPRVNLTSGITYRRFSSARSTARQTSRPKWSPATAATRRTPAVTSRVTSTSSSTSTVRTRVTTRTTTRTSSTTERQVSDEERWFVYGVTSFGSGCGLNWGVYQRVSAFNEWMRETMATYN